MSNYTKPYDKDYEDTPEDYLFLVMTFGKVLSTMLNNGQGILIDLKGDALKLQPEAKRVIIFNDGNMIRVIKANERTDLQDGDFVQMIDKNNIIN